jgi:hypothetical protein
VIHVATVHYRDDRWIEPQLRFLRRNLGPDHRIYAVLNGIDPAWDREFAYTSDLEGNHASKLNALAEVVRADADPDDLLLFVDGDAFPIAPVDRDLLAGTSLAAVRRSENLGDQQPHPCFALTTVGFWFDFAGDWRKGYRWTSSVGVSVTDVGGNLLGILTEGQIPWRPLLRSNRVDLDPLWFGIYADVAYHHGAGFRNKIARHVKVAGEAQVRAAASLTRSPSWLPVLGRAERYTRAKLAKRRHLRRLEEARRHGERLSAEVFDWIRTDDEFYRRFLEPDGASARAIGEARR